ncbi:MAG: PorP/SprF family type IX secretion system membrane protein [Bacteroidota bacterium]
MRLLIVILLLGCNQVLFGQQMTQYSQWAQHSVMINPAHLGIEKGLEMHSLYRFQWVGLEGAPRSGGFAFSLQLDKRQKKYFESKHGIGVRFEADQIGQFNTNRVNFGYAPHFVINEQTRLSFGIYAGILQMGFNHASATTVDDDPAVLREAVVLAPDASFGALWAGRNYYAGVTLNQLIPWKWDGLGNDSKFRFHTSVQVGYKMNFSDNIRFLPAVLVKIPPRGPVAIDLQAMFDFSQKVQAGIAYRNNDAIAIFAGFKIKQRFSVYYSYDIGISSLRGAHAGSHEVSLAFTTRRIENTATYHGSLF